MNSSQHLAHYKPFTTHSSGQYAISPHNTEMLCIIKGYVNTIQGPVSLTVFPSQFKFDGNFVSLSSRF